LAPGLIFRLPVTSPTGGFAQVQRFEDSGFGDQRFAGTGRGTDQNALVGSEPVEKGFFLNGVRLERDRVKIELGDFVTAIL